MDNFTADVIAAPLGAACLLARATWTNIVAAGPDHALRQSHVLGAGSLDARRAGIRPAAVEQAQQAQAQFAALMGGTELPTTTVTVIPNPKNAHKTRTNAGGYGAMGPHPERERLA